LLLTLCLEISFFKLKNIKAKFCTLMSLPAFMYFICMLKLQEPLKELLTKAIKDKRKKQPKSSRKVKTKTTRARKLGYALLTSINLEIPNLISVQVFD
jgi:hypothetical protein